MTDTTAEREGEVLARLCETHGVPFELAQELLEVEREYQTSQRRHGIYDRLKEVIEESVSDGESESRA